MLCREPVLHLQTNCLNIMSELKNILISFGYSPIFLEKRLSFLSLENEENIWYLKNEFDDPYILFFKSSKIIELDKIDSLVRDLPTMGIIVFYNDSIIEKIQVRNFIDNSLSFLNELEHPIPIDENKGLLYGDPEKGYKPLKPIDTSVENLFFEAHSIIRDIDGLHPDQALDEICKFIYAKLFDEEFNQNNGANFVQKLRYLTVEEAASAIRSIYKKSTEYDERVYSVRIPKYKKSRGVFNSEIKLSSPAIYKLISLFESIDLTNSKIDVKGRAFQKMLLPAMRAGMGQYFTPLPVIEFIVEVLSPNVDDLIIDPFSGSGHFLSQSLNYIINNHKIPDKKLHEFKFYKLHGIEKSERMARISMTDMRLHGDGHSNIRCTDALLSFDNYEDLKENSFDIVMSNPPFGSILSAEAIERLDNFELLNRKKTLPLEIIGMERCIQLLRPGGKFGIVLPESVLTNKNSKFVRDWLMNNVVLFGMVSLPLETFSPFGANIKTIILFGRKNKIGQTKTNNTKILIGKIEFIGYDFKGQPIEKNDIIELIEPLKSLFQES